MPGKSRHRKGKHIVQTKKRKGRRSPQAIVSQQKTVAQSDKPDVIPPEVTTPSPGAVAAAPAAVGHRELFIELRRIGILAGIMLATLIILVLVLD
jgi:hypothetical protein